MKNRLSKNFLELFYDELLKAGLKKSDKFLIATSGGSDSTALCFLCSLLFPQKNFKLALVDHKYRKNSTQEALFVKKYYQKKLGLNLDILTNKAPIPKNGLEEYFREVRYSLLFEFCLKNKISKIITAHHLDDQIETFLMRLERGSGLDGLSGIQSKSVFIHKKKKFTLIRPLLNFSKTELTSILTQNNIDWVEDESNKNTEFTRNNIRACLQSFSDYEQIKKRLSTVIENINRAKTFIESEQKKSEEKIIIKKNKTSAILDLKKFIILDEELRLRILKKIVSQLKKTEKSVRLEKIKNLDYSIKNLNLKSYSLYHIDISVQKSDLVFKTQKNKKIK